MVFRVSRENHDPNVRLKEIMENRHILVLCAAVAGLSSGCRQQESEAQVNGSQPELQIELTQDSSTTTDVSRVIQAATQFWPPPDTFWTQPERLYDADSDWVVWFKRKEMSVIRDGEEFIIKTRPGGQGVFVSKTDFSCRMMGSR
jgi:hypothetical protein